MNEKTPRFAGQQDGELIIYSFCEHAIVLIMQFLKLMFITLVFGIFAYITYLLYINKVLHKEVIKWIFFVLLIFYGYFFHSRTARIFDSIMKIYIVTNTRIVIIDKGIFFKDYKDIIDLRKIQDITSNESGLLSNFLSYGDIEITLASSSGIRKIKTVPVPHKIVEIIDRAKRSNITVRHEEKLTNTDTDRSTHDNEPQINQQVTTPIDPTPKQNS